MGRRIASTMVSTSPPIARIIAGSKSAAKAASRVAMSLCCWRAARSSASSSRPLASPLAMRCTITGGNALVAAKADVAAIVQALKLYRLDNGFYPSTDQGLVALAQRPTTNPVPGNWKQGGYIERLPKDPWGGDYQYLNPGVRSEIDVFSLGADRARGGEGNNADIGNWD